MANSPVGIVATMSGKQTTESHKQEIQASNAPKQRKEVVDVCVVAQREDVTQDQLKGQRMLQETVGVILLWIKLIP